MSRFASGIVVLVCVAFAGTEDAFADPVKAARLRYARAADAASCPEEDELKSTVSARLGYDPFRPEAASLVAASIVRAGKGLRARVELSDRSGIVTGQRELTSNTTDCAELASALALAISIAIDPLTLTRPTPPAPVVAAPPAPVPPPSPVPTAPVVVAAPPAPVIPHPPPLPPVKEPIEIRFSVGALAAFGVSPGPASPGFTLQVGFRIRRFSLGVEARGDLPISGDTRLGRVETELLGAAILPCYHPFWFQLCGEAFFGAMRASGVDTSTPRLDTQFYTSLGARFGIEIPIWRALAARIHADLLAPLVLYRVQINGANAYTTPSVGGLAGAALLGRF